MGGARSTLSFHHQLGFALHPPPPRPSSPQAGCHDVQLFWTPRSDWGTALDSHTAEEHAEYGAQICLDQLGGDWKYAGVAEDYIKDLGDKLSTSDVALFLPPLRDAAGGHPDVVSLMQI